MDMGVVLYDLEPFTGRRAYSVAGPATWNSLPDELRNPNNSTDSFKRSLKTFLFSEY